MDTVARAVEVLELAEADLRRLVSNSATSGDYHSVVKIASWASAVSDLLKGVGKARVNGKAMRRVAPAAAKPVARGKAQPDRNGYPRFFRQGEHLVRIAWSKREKKAYQHKAPRAVLKSLTTAMAKAGADGRVFSTDDLLPIREQDGSETPSYQAYVGIALLKQTGLIDQHGRQGYSIPRLGNFQDAVESVWKKLPTQ